MIRFFTLMSCLFLLHCGQKALTQAQYARFYAKKSLIQQYYRGKDDSLKAYVAGLYKSEGVSAEQVQRFIEKTNSSPEQWVEIQQKIVAEMEKLNPANKNKPVPKP
jgi:hypothetical protein